MAKRCSRKGLTSVQVTEMSTGKSGVSSVGAGTKYLLGWAVAELPLQCPGSGLLPSDIY